jgi:hypothetical protein
VLTTCCTLALGLAGPAFGADKPRLLLADEGLPLQEIRPQDRRVYVLTLDGRWQKPPAPGIAHHVNVLFPNGQAYSHRVLDDALFRKGEVRCLLPEYQLIRNGVARGGDLTVVVSAGRSVGTATAPEVISDTVSVRWPLKRPVVRLPPPTRHTPPRPIDDFPLPGGELPKKPAPPRKVEPLPPPKLPKDA